MVPELATSVPFSHSAASASDVTRAAVSVPVRTWVVLAAVAPAMPVVSIGPETSAAAKAAGLVVLAEANEPGVDGLVWAVAEAG